MRIKKGQKLGGVPIKSVRDLLRRFRQPIIFSVDTVRERLRVDRTRARRLVQALLRAGYIAEDSYVGERKRWYEVTLAGTTLAGASMAKPLRRSTVDRLLKELVQRAREINADRAYAYRVASLVLFGSALGDKPRPGDVDVAVTLAKRHLDPKRQKRAERARVRLALMAGRRFRGLDDLYWPHNEVLRDLRGRSRGLSFSDGEAPLRLAAASRVIFDGWPRLSIDSRARLRIKGEVCR